MLRENSVGLIGVGLMGQPMGFNWLKKGISLTVLPHKKRSRCEELEKAGAKIVNSMKELVNSSKFIILMLPTSREVEKVVEELENYLKYQNLLIDMSTSEPASTVKIFNRLSQNNIKFFDCPVTGGVKGAVEGTLTLFVGGPKEYYEEAKDILQAVSRIQTHFGKAGQGHAAKIINNFVCIGNLAVLAEALPLSKKLGLQSEAMYQTLVTGTGASRMLELYGTQILDGDFAPRFKLAHAYKDLLIAEDISKQVSISLPVLKGIIEDFNLAMNQNLGEENISSLLKPLEAKLNSKFRK